MKKSLTKIILLLSVSSLFAVSGCRLDSETEKVTNPILLYVAENSTLACSDRLDNDADSLDDCEDPDCLDLGTAEVPGPGATVCPNQPAAGANGNFSCSNGMQPIYISEDNARCLTENNDYVCSDGKDNDGNGFTDCNDNSCKGMKVCCMSNGVEGTFETCSDGMDNDCNGYIDCSDYACTRNDGNRYFATPEAIAYCNSMKCPDGIVAEGSLETCSDGRDNDCNGYVDCADYACSRNGTPEAIEYCKRDMSKKPENTEEACSDGIDNDLDGYADCDDQNCSSFAYCQNLVEEPAPRPSDFASKSAEERAQILSAEKTVCTDGEDNNHNGLIDCKEYRCRLRSLETLTGDEAQYNFECE